MARPKLSDRPWRGREARGHSARSLPSWWSLTCSEGKGAARSDDVDPSDRPRSFSHWRRLRVASHGCLPYLQHPGQGPHDSVYAVRHGHRTRPDSDRHFPSPPVSLRVALRRSIPRRRVTMASSGVAELITCPVESQHSPAWSLGPPPSGLRARRGLKERRRSAPKIPQLRPLALPADSTEGPRSTRCR